MSYSYTPKKIIDLIVFKILLRTIHKRSNSKTYFFIKKLSKVIKNIFSLTKYKESTIVSLNKGHGEAEMIIQSAVFTKLKTINSNIIKHQHKFKESSLVE